MAGKNGLLFGLGAAAVLYFGTKAFNIKEAIAKLTVARPKIKLTDIKLLSVALDITLDIVNPGSVNIPFEYYAGTIIYDTTKIADFNFNGNGKNIVLKARSATPITFRVNVTTVNLVRKLAKLVGALAFKNTNVDTTMTVTSSIYAAGVDVPVNFIYDLRTQSTV